VGTNIGKIQSSADSIQPAPNCSASRELVLDLLQVLNLTNTLKYYSFLTSCSIKCKV
jgi:hypothetical protein